MKSKNRFTIEPLKRMSVIKLSGTIRTQTSSEGVNLLKEATNYFGEEIAPTIDMSAINFCNSSFFVAMAIFINSFENKPINLIANEKSMWQKRTIGTFQSSFKNVEVKWVS
jgi:hypothetical protein